MDRMRPRQPLGPQIHAVPDHEKAYDANGKRLPWAYDTLPNVQLENDREQRNREPVEKGPFGKRTGSRRNTSRSRSKTAEPHLAKEDAARREQQISEEKVFGSLRRVTRDDGGQGRSKADREGGDTGSGAQQAVVPTMKLADGEGEATEALLYGFGEDLQWSAIDFYERVSGGIVLEDYERTAPSAGHFEAYDPTHSYARASMTRSLSKAALRKKNKYAGGNYWIKITFSSREAAELAVARSPHVIRGHLVYCEPWQGRGPARDEPVLATQAGAQILDDALPMTFSTTTNMADASPGHSSETMTSATVDRDEQGLRARLPWDQQLSSFGAAAATGNDLARSPSQPFGSQSLSQRQTQQQLLRTPSTVSRVRGAQLATLLPAEAALMPKPPKQSFLAWFGGREVIGTTVPRNEKGEFDAQRGGLYWRVWSVVDWFCGTDFCGVKGDD
ncbi:hypothetical protein LTR62_001813 [Meristemomyces frigidus]|uniref:Nucleoporin NUP53 n=1 Tax=Meristemomyces frigidus TaxID=1508187 RepID=A0AAN7YQH0_9PEZI|nr:hypothetical protein LTR62_001813 [Meristemomyces frigidus]